MLIVKNPFPERSRRRYIFADVTKSCEYASTIVIVGDLFLQATFLPAPRRRWIDTLALAAKVDTYVQYI